MFVVAVLLGCPSATLPQAVKTASLFLPETPQPQWATVSVADLAETAEPSTSLDREVQVQADRQRPSAQDQALTDEQKKRAAEEESQRELHQRLGGVVPNFNAVLNGSTLPLTPKQKMRASFRSAIDPYQFGLAFVTAGYGQATDSHSSIDPNGTRHGYGQGWAGFGERYGANYVDQFNGTIIGNGVLPVLLHQDPRYFRMGTGAFSKRFFYSLTTTVRCKSDKGRWQPNYSNVLGNLVSGGISNLYYPRADRGAALTIEQGMTVTAEGVIGALLIEFFPDVQQHFRRKHEAKP